MRAEDIVIVGAGPFGLGLGRELRSHGLNPLIVERGDAPAAAWRSRHPQLRLNTHRLNSGLPGRPIPRSAGAFPTLADYISFLDGIAANSGCRIETNCDVIRVDHATADWVLETSNGPIRSAEVVFATGFDHTPFKPVWPGTDRFAGVLRHARDLGDVAAYAGKSVLVVGAGNSAVDCLNTLVNARTAQLAVSVRGSATTVPVRMLGFPIQLSAPMMENLPAGIADMALQLTERLAFGDLSRLGLGARRGDAATRLKQYYIAPAVDRGFIAALRRGDVTVHSEIARFEGSAVVFKNESRVEPDVVIAATGYTSGLEGLVGHLGVLTASGKPKNCGSPVLPGLRFALMPPPLGGSLRAIARSVRPLARSIAKEISIASTRKGTSSNAPSAQRSGALRDAA